MNPCFPALEGRQADAVAVSPCGRGAAVVCEGQVHGVWDEQPWVFDVGQRSRRPHGTWDDVVYGPDAHVLVAVAGRYAIVEGRTGELQRRFTRKPRSRPVRRGLISTASGLRAVLEDPEGWLVFDPFAGRAGKVERRLDVPVAFMGALNHSTVGPRGRVFAVGGSEGMDAGWYERIDLLTGESLERGSCGYAIDTVELDDEGGLLFIDNYLGLAGFVHPGERADGFDLWLQDEVLYLTDRAGVLRLTETTRSRWACMWPRGLTVGKGCVAVTVDGQARFAGADRFDERSEDDAAAP